MENIATLSLSIRPLSRDADYEQRPFSLGPMLQSVLMEHIEASYASQLHASELNPYSQHCFATRDGSIIWRISTLTSEATEKIIVPASKIDTFKLRNLDATFEVTRRSCESFNVATLLDALKEDAPSAFRIYFRSPTAFRSKGNYVIFPDVRLIFQSLLMRYNQAYAGDAEIDDETLDYITEHTKITSYNLHSQYFPRTMGRADKIPAFMGSLTIHASGPQPLRGLIAMLLAFGDAAGVGIKTSMGMGGMAQIERKPARKGETIGR